MVRMGQGVLHDEFGGKTLGISTLHQRGGYRQEAMAGPGWKGCRERVGMGRNPWMALPTRGQGRGRGLSTGWNVRCGESVGGAGVPTTLRTTRGSVRKAMRSMGLEQRGPFRASPWIGYGLLGGHSLTKVAILPRITVVEGISIPYSTKSRPRAAPSHTTRPRPPCRASCRPSSRRQASRTA